MRIIGMAVVKNEADIIEAFVRHNRSLLDGLFVIDNGSTDATRTLLDRLAAEDPSLVLADDASLDHQQQAAMTEAARFIAEGGAYDYLVPLDADEFLRCDGRTTLEHALTAIPPGSIGQLLWVTYAPRLTDDAAEPDVVKRIVHRRAREQPQWCKVVIPVQMVREPGFRIAMGNHSAVTWRGQAPTCVLAGVTLAHFPVRSAEQIIGKALIGSWATLRKPNRLFNENCHWHELARRFERGPVITPEEVEQIAVKYADIGEDGRRATGTVELVRDPLPVHGRAPLSWPALARVDVLQRVAAYAGACFVAKRDTYYENDCTGLGRAEHGVIAYPKKDPGIGRALQLYGEWNRGELETLLTWVAPGDNIAHVGAHVGAQAIPLAQAIAPSGKVWAIEPHRLFFQMLCGNAALNGVTNLFAYNQAVGEMSGAAVPCAQPGQAADDVEEQVPVKALDDMRLARVKLIVIDTSGSERFVLRGARAIIARDSPMLFVRCEVESETKPLLLQLAAMGYRCWWSLSSRFNPANRYQNSVDMFAESGDGSPAVALICAHASRSEQPTGGGIEVTGPNDTWQQARARGTGGSGSAKNKMSRSASLCAGRPSITAVVPALNAAKMVQHTIDDLAMAPRTRL